jgi:aminoglycoside phosphotransferase family enzyme
MDTPTLIRALTAPSAYPHPAPVECRQTHASAVFLVGELVYKVKKPADLGFLDFTTLAKRRHFCEEEVRLNRRLAPGVYLGVVPITLAGAGVAMEGEGEPVEWAVKMRRLPDDATLERRLGRSEMDPGQMRSLARRVAAFHAGAACGPHIARFGAFEVVAGNARDNFVQSAPWAGLTVGREAFERLRALNERALGRLRPLIESRARRGVPRDTHGDLRMDHVYLFPDRAPPDDLAIIDCVEFNERFRFADPVADMAFLVMGLRYAGHGGLADVFADEYFRASGDEEGRSLLPFYTAYRAAVRAKVEGLRMIEPEVPEAGRRAARVAACGHWRLALSELGERGNRTGPLTPTPRSGRMAAAHSP